MSIKTKYEETKAKAAQLMRDRPLETLAVAAATATAVAKVIDTVSRAQNAATWKREVKRRERSRKTR